ncbi:MAG: RluA family pseudouridine synthase [Clostridia bacterium]|nr:RluA family pseudouridine synthase [Clostridia bacterium]
MELKYSVNESEDGMKIAKILMKQLKISNRLLTKLKMNEKILVNDIPVFSNYLVHKGDLITVKLDFIEEDTILPEQINLDILYEDEYFLIVNKPAGMVVHPCTNHPNGTLANGVKHYLNNHKKIRAINRLDRDTSGIVLFAKNEYIQELMIKYANMKKEYIAIVEGTLEEKIGTINKPIKRKNGSIMEREVSEEGQIAITHYEVIQELEIENNLTVLKLSLETGRTHQIRVHLAYMGNPILGDTLYGKESALISRQALHAFHLQFEHPIMKGYIINIMAPLPRDMNEIVLKGKKDSQ